MQFSAVGPYACEPHLQREKTDGKMYETFPTYMVCYLYADDSSKNEQSRGTHGNAGCMTQTSNTTKKKKAKTTTSARTLQENRYDQV